MGFLSANVVGSSDGQNTETSCLTDNINQIFAAYHFFSACTELPAKSFTVERPGQIMQIMKKDYTNDTIEKMHMSFTYLQG